jgi:hypothetical protein
MFDDPGNSQYEAMAPGSSWNDAMSNKAKRRPATTRFFLLNDMAVCDCRRVLAVRILHTPGEPMCLVFIARLERCDEKYIPYIS